MNVIISIIPTNLKVTREKKIDGLIIRRLVPFYVCVSLGGMEENTCRILAHPMVWHGRNRLIIFI